MDHGRDIGDQFVIQCFAVAEIQVLLTILLSVLQIAPPIVRRDVAAKHKDGAVSVVGFSSGKGTINAFEELFKVGIHLAGTFIPVFALSIKNVPRKVASSET